MLRITQTTSGEHPAWPGLVHVSDGTYPPRVEGVLPSLADHCEYQHGVLDGMGNEVAAFKRSPATTPGGYGLSDGEPPMGNWSSQAWRLWKSDMKNRRPWYQYTEPFASSAALQWLSPTPEQRELKRQREENKSQTNPRPRSNNINANTSTFGEYFKVTTYVQTQLSSIGSHILTNCIVMANRRDENPGPRCSKNN
jgi:hypothetical protein